MKEMRRRRSERTTTTVGSRRGSRVDAGRFPMNPSGFCAEGRKRVISARQSGGRPLEEELRGRSVVPLRPMRIITSRVHGMLDYAVGILLILAPQVLDLGPGAESRVLVWLGVAALVYSVLTRYELGLVRLLPFRGHLGLDFVHAVILTSSPWVFGFADRVWVPHLVLGLAEFGVVALSQRFSPVDVAIPMGR